MTGIIDIIGGVSMIADTIKELREQNGLSQTQLAKKLNITRSSVCAWEQGLSSPTAQYIIELANLFRVSTDYILGVSKEQTLNLSNLNKKEKLIVYNLIQYFEEMKK